MNTAENKTPECRFCHKPIEEHWWPNRYGVQLCFNCTVGYRLQGWL